MADGGDDMDTPVRPPKEELGRHGLREGDTE